MCDGEDCCKKMAKFLLVIINLFFFLLGLLMLAFGIAMVAAPEKVAEAVQKTGADLSILGDSRDIIKGAGIFMIVLGGIVTLIGAFGFFGACCENKALLVIYLIVVIIILLAEIALIIFAAVFPDKLMEYVQKGMNKTMIDTFRQDVRVYPNVTIGSIEKDTAYSWAATQFGAKCCGTYAPSDYYNGTRYYSTADRNITLPDGTSVIAVYPISCCKVKDTAKFPNIKSDDFVDLKGCLMGQSNSVNEPNCYTAIEKMISQASRIAIGIAAAIVGLQIIIIVLGFILCCTMHNKSHTV